MTKHVTTQDVNALLNQAKSYDEVRESLYKAKTAHEEPALVVVSGRSGSGKTTVATKLAEDMKAVHLSADARRKALHGCAPEERLDGHVYADLEHIKAHAENMREEIEEAIYAGHSVVVDVAACSARSRADFEQVAKDTGAEFVGLFLDVSKEVARGRVEQRGPGVSDMSVYEFDHQESRREAILDSINEKAQRRGGPQTDDLIKPKDYEKNWHMIHGEDRPHVVGGQALTKVEMVLERQIGEPEPEIEVELELA